MVVLLCPPSPSEYWSSALLLFQCDCSLVAGRTGWVLPTSITVSSPTTLYPSSSGKVGWPLEDLFPCLLEDLACPASGKFGFLHLTVQWIQNVDVVTATSAQGQIGSDFPFRRGGLLLLALRHIYISCLCVFFHFFRF